MRVTVVRVGSDTVMFADHGEPGAAWISAARGAQEAVPLIGQVGELLVDGEEWLFEADDGVRAEQVALTAVGRDDEMTYRLAKRHEPVGLAGCGVAPRHKRQAAALGFWRLVPASSLAGHFDHPDLPAWSAEQDEKVRDRQARVARAESLRPRRELRADPRGHFVNPYTFVPLPESPPVRGKPAGHHTLDADDGAVRFQGTITARLVARSPLLVRNIDSSAPMRDGVARAPRTPGGDLFIPGSTLHGAIRALHETLSGSCLRVFDPDFVPVYRDVASGALREGWDLGLVAEVDDRGRPTRLLRCTQTKWVELDTLLKAVDQVVTGQRFDLDDDGFDRVHGREVYNPEREVRLNERDGRWVVLVTDDSARANEHYHFAVGRLPESGETYELTDRAWAAFRRAAEGTKQFYAGRGEARPDLAAERRRLAQPGTSLDDVLGRPVGKFEQWRGKARWLLPRPWLHKDQVVWLAPPMGRHIGGIALSYLWRTAGLRDAGERLRPAGYAACHDPTWLCPSCAVFGSADTRDPGARGVDRRAAEQRSYRGHVRVLDAVADPADVPDPVTVTLPAVGSPRPGSGQFYLDDPAAATARLAYQRPRSRWGPTDPTEPRHLRGRKFYWQTDPDTDARRRRWQRHDDEAHGGERVELVARGSRYRLRLTFDGLTGAQLGGLVAALQPQRLFAARTEPLPYPTETEPGFAIHVGGGKPLGLGSCQVEDVTVAAHDAGSRYLTPGPAREVDADELVAEFVAEHADRLSGTWQDLAAALHTDHVDSRIVGYPTDVPWADEHGRCAGRRRHESFRWFRNTTGEYLREDNSRPRPFVPLPSVRDINSALPVDPEAQQ